MKESPAFVRTHDLLLWLLQTTRKFPREQRFVMAQRLHERAFAVQDALNAAVLDAANEARHLLLADIALLSLRKSLLLAYQLGLLSAAQFRHVSQLDGDVGRLIGSWRNKKGG